MEDCQDVISKLKFLSKINKGEKINVTKLILQTEGIVTSISRSFWNTDNRNNAISFIQNTINQSITLIFKYAKSERESEQILAKEMIKDLKSSKNGIVNLKTAYKSDTMFCCNIDAFIQGIDAKMQEYSKTLPDLFDKNEDHTP